MIRFGIIGRNFITEWMLAAMAAVDGVAPVKIYSRDPLGAQEFARSHNIPGHCGCLEELAADPDLDAVYIASPNALHYEQAKLMLTHGKHVLLEKPACANAGQLRELLALAQEKKLILIEAMRTIYDDAPEIIERAIPKIAPLCQVRFDYGKRSSRWERFLKEGEKVNTFNPKLSNAAVMDLGCYGIHALVRLFGRPSSVSAQSVKLENGFEALGTVLMNYGSFTAEVSYSKVHNIPGDSYLVGMNGMIRLNNIGDTAWIRLCETGGEEIDLGYREKKPNNMTAELEAFKCFVDGSADPAKVWEYSLITAEIIDEVRRQAGIVFPDDQ